MPEQSKFTPLTLRTYSEALRRDLYDAVVKHLWTPDDPGDYVPSYTPEAAQLMVLYLHGRWIVQYLDLEELENAPPDQRMVMSRVVADRSRPFGIQLQEV
jgi:hypothetical protein